MDRTFVSRAGVKLDHALSEFAFDVTGMTCADFGCNVGGFTDCLLQRGAAKVLAIDTGYGTLDYRLRVDDRVTVMERTNALHEEVAEPVDLVVIDLAWTPQRLAIPAALRWLSPDGYIISLVKPHYELDNDEKREMLTDGFLPPDHAPAVLERVVGALPSMGAQVHGQTQSPLTGGKSSRRKRRASGAAGNVEFLLLLAALKSTK